MNFIFWFKGYEPSWDDYWYIFVCCTFKKCYIFFYILFVYYMYLISRLKWAIFRNILWNPKWRMFSGSLDMDYNLQIFFRSACLEIFNFKSLTKQYPKNALLLFCNSSLETVGKMRIWWKLKIRGGGIWLKKMKN